MSEEERDPFADSADVHEGVLLRSLASWEEFVDLIRTEHANCPAYIYRGQANADWKVEATLDRLEKQFPRKKNYVGDSPADFDCSPAGRSDHLNAFIEVARGKRGPSTAPPSEDEWWALAQHHGLPTPMLDWTYYPFVALFFAFEQENCLNEAVPRERVKERAVFTLAPHLLREGDSSSHSAPRPFSPTGESSYRLANQGGLFLRMPKGTDLESWIRKHFPDETGDFPHPARAVLQRIVIPNRDRLDCLKFLNKMNINRMSLFPDLDGAARYINALWELDFDTSLGRFIDRE